MKTGDKPEQREGPGGYHSEISIGSVRVFVAPKEWPPFLADALVEEEDTYLVLSADPEVQDTREQPEELMAEHHKSRIMVVDTRDRLVGVISMSDLVSGEGDARAAATLRRIAEREVHAH